MTRQEEYTSPIYLIRKNIKKRSDYQDLIPLIGKAFYFNSISRDSFTYCYFYVSYSQKRYVTINSINHTYYLPIDSVTHKPPIIQILEELGI